jgi:quercetin dioxygenase-like cupin family protein
MLTLASIVRRHTPDRPAVRDQEARMGVTRGNFDGTFGNFAEPDWETAAQFEGRVKQEPVGEIKASDGTRGTAISLVHFHHGARTYKHSHAGGQILVVLRGQGRVWSERDGQVVEVGPGDVVHEAPGVLHWHGAANGADMSHLSIAVGDATWPEDSPPAE